MEQIESEKQKKKEKRKKLDTQYKDQKVRESVEQILMRVFIDN